MNRINRFSFFPVLACLCDLTIACGGKDDTEPVPPPEPPELVVTRLSAVGGPSFEPDAACVELGTDADQSLLVTLEGTSATSIGEWLLRPPGTCGSTAACGHLQARIDPETTSAGSAGASTGLTDQFSYALQATGATTTLTLPFARPCPSLAPARECRGLDDPTGTHTLELTLRDDDGLVVLAPGDATPTTTTLTLTLAAAGDCPAP